MRTSTLPAGFVLEAFVALGLTLGLGYLAKAAMFPAALLLIGILFLKPPKDGLGRRHAVIALACFCLVAAPLVLSLSHEKHRFTFGDSGKLNYAWFVGDIPAYSGWNGQPAENGIPAHAPRTISQAPLVLEFRTPVGGTLPIWYDPSYWWEGLRVPISVQRQLAGLFRPFTQVHSMQTVFLALAAGLAPFCLLNFRVRKVIREGGIQTWILILWPAATCLMYSLVLFNFRYVVAYLVLIGLGAAALLLQPFQGRRQDQGAARGRAVARPGGRSPPASHRASSLPSRQWRASGPRGRQGQRAVQPGGGTSDWRASGSGPEMKSRSSGAAWTVTMRAWQGFELWPRSGRTRIRLPV